MEEMFYNFLNLDGGKCLVVGISGATCAGKTTLTKLLQGTFRWAKVVHQDAYFYPNDPKYHVYLPEIKCFNWELATALNFERMESDVKKLVAGESVDMTCTPFFDNKDFVLSHYPSNAEAQNFATQFSDVRLIILEGHIIFNRPFFNELCNKKFFLTLSKEECKRRRRSRKYDPMPPPGFFDKCVWPSFEQRLSNVQHLNGISYLDADQVELVDIYSLMKKSIVNALSKIGDGNGYTNDNW